MFIVDTHAHLDQIENIEQVLEDAKAAGVSAIMAVGVDLAANLKNLELRTRFGSSWIYVGLGIHPGNIKAEELTATLDFIRANISQADAVGEIGLDFW
jgi:TatD DNase family protein